MLALAVPLIFAFARAAAPACAPADQITEDMLQNIPLMKSRLGASGSKIKTVEDFICCLPQKFRKSFVIGHSSLAGQSGTPSSPRLLLFDEGTPEHGQTSSTVLSVNGGAEGQLQAQNVEFAVRNRTTGQTEFFDLELAGGEKKFSGRNPALCMNCHGSAGQVPKHGPRLIFDPFIQWKAFHSGDGLCQPAESELTAAAEKLSERALKTNPRFRCLDPGAGAGKGQAFGARQATLLSKLDTALRTQDRVRTDRLWQETEDFQAYKYAYAGAFFCNNGSTVGKERWSPDEWLPPEIIARLQRTESLQDRARSGPLQYDRLAPEFSKIEAEGRERTTRQRALLASPDKLAEQPIEKESHWKACQTLTGDQDRRTMEKILADERQPEIYRRYVADEFLLPQKFQPSTGSPERRAALRYLTEGRGVDLSLMTMDLQGRHGNGPAFPADDEISAIVTADKGCETLKRKSMESLKKLLADRKTKPAGDAPRGRR